MSEDHRAVDERLSVGRSGSKQRSLRQQQVQELVSLSSSLRLRLGNSSRSSSSSLAALFENASPAPAIKEREERNGQAELNSQIEQLKAELAVVKEV